jgi:hypothetical protein
VEDPLGGLLSNMSKPALAIHYQKEVQGIISQLLLVSKNLSPTLCDVLDEMIIQSEQGTLAHADRSFTLFISYGSNYF